MADLQPGSLPTTLTGAVDDDYIPVSRGASTGKMKRSEALADVLRNGLDIGRSVVKGVVSPAQRLTNATALQTAITECIAAGRVAILQPGRYEYTATMTQSGNNVGWQLPKELLGLIGAGSGLVQLVNFATNHPALTIGDVSIDPAAATENAIYRGFAVGHGATQAGQTSAHGLLLGRIFFSDFDDIEISPFFGGGHPYVGLQIGLSSNQFFFSNRLGTIAVRGGQQHIMRFTSNTTGNAWGNAYFGGGTFGGRVVLASTPVFFESTGVIQGSFEQMNIEWCEVGDSFHALRSDSLGLDIGTLNLEGNRLVGFNPALIHSVESRINIRQLRALNNWIAAANTTGTPRVFNTYGSGVINVRQGTLFWDGAGVNAEAVMSRSLLITAEGDTSVVGRRPAITLRDMTIGGPGLTGTTAADATATQAASGAGGFLRGFGRYEWHRKLPRTVSAEVEMADADLTVYAAHANLTVKQTATLTAARTLTLSDRLGSSGQPGAASTRRAGDIVQVHRAGGGAFNLLVKDHTGTTINTITGAGADVFFEWSGSAWSVV